MRVYLDSVGMRGCVGGGGGVLCICKYKYKCRGVWVRRREGGLFL